MNLIEALKNLSDLSFDLFQGQEDIIIVDKDGNEIKKFELSGNKLIMK